MACARCQSRAVWIASLRVRVLNGRKKYACGAAPYVGFPSGPIRARRRGGSASHARREPKQINPVPIRSEIKVPRHLGV